MRRPIRSQQSDLFSAPAAAPLLFPATTRTELVSLLGALLLEVMSYEQPKLIITEKELNHE